MFVVVDVLMKSSEFLEPLLCVLVSVVVLYIGVVVVLDSTNASLDVVVLNSLIVVSRK